MTPYLETEPPPADILACNDVGDRVRISGKKDGNAYDLTGIIRGRTHGIYVIVDDAGLRHVVKAATIFVAGPDEEAP